MANYPRYTDWAAVHSFLSSLMHTPIRSVLFLFGRFINQVHKLIEFWRDDDLRAAVALFAHLGGIRCDGIILATPANGEPFGIYAIVGLQELHHRRGAQS